MRSRAEKRLAELESIDVESLDAEAKAAIDQKIEKTSGDAAHVRRAAARQRYHHEPIGRKDAVSPRDVGARTSSDGRASGIKKRIILDVLVDASSSDVGKLGSAMLRAREALVKAGVPSDVKIQVAAGYFTGEDLAFALGNRTWLDALIDERKRHGTAQLNVENAFTLDDFRRGPDDSMTCPAGRTMIGPSSGGRNLMKWQGSGCSTCDLKPRCTNGSRRTVVLNVAAEDARAAMVHRMRQPDARPRYAKRMATIEAVFSLIEDEMGFRRVNSRKADAVTAEILLKALAYNVRRLIDAKRRIFHIRMLVAYEPTDGAAVAA